MEEDSIEEAEAEESKHKEEDVVAVGLVFLLITHDSEKRHLQVKLAYVVYQTLLHISGRH